MNDEAREFTAAAWSCCLEADYWAEREPVAVEINRSEVSNAGRTLSGTAGESFNRKIRDGIRRNG